MPSCMSAEGHDYVPVTHRTHGFEFVYTGASYIQVTEIDGGRKAPLYIPDWINLPMIDREAFLLLCILWLQREDLVRR
jgi:hypothetical protein